MLVQYATDDLRELNRRLVEAFQGTVGMSSDMLTACRRAVMHGMLPPFPLRAAHARLIHDLEAGLTYARQRRLDAVVGYCMAAAQSPDLLVEANGVTDLVVSFVQETIPCPARVLDVAAGTGRFAIPLAAEGYEVTLFDPAVPFLEKAVRRAPSGVAQNFDSLICGTFEDLASMASGSYDVCLCMRSVFYAHPRPFAEEVIFHLGRIARTAVALDVLSKESLIRRLDDEGFDSSPETVRHIRETGVTPPAKPEGGCVVYSCFSTDELAQVLPRAGLRVHRLLGCGFGDEGSPLDHSESEIELYPYLLALCRTDDLTEHALG